VHCEVVADVHVAATEQCVTLGQVVQTVAAPVLST
jgi:hypothetical protein